MDFVKKIKLIINRSRYPIKVVTHIQNEWYEEPKFHTREYFENMKEAIERIGEQCKQIAKTKAYEFTWTIFYHSNGSEYEVELNSGVINAYDSYTRVGIYDTE